MKYVGRKNCKVELLDRDVFETKQDMFTREKHFIKLFGTLNKFHGDKEVVKEIENKINASDVVSTTINN